MTSSSNPRTKFHEEGVQAARDFREGRKPKCPYDSNIQWLEAEAWEEGFQLEYNTMFGDPE